MVGSDIAPTATKTLGERSHHDVDIGWVHAPVLRHTPSCLTHGTDTVSFIKVEVCLGGREGGRERERESGKKGKKK